jgi:hypothetical protein
VREREVDGWVAEEVEKRLCVSLSEVYKAG